MELGEYGIRVNSIHPYSIATPMILNDAMLAVLGKAPELPAQLRADAVPAAGQGRQGGQDARDFMTAGRPAEVVVWLAGDRSGLLSGSQISVDRGVMKLLKVLNDPQSRASKY